jgi:molybdopterin synthase catalytic subunit
MATIRIQTTDFDVAEESALMRERSRAIGAIASFVGVVRDVNDGSGVSRMTLEHYPGMTERALESIVAEASARWNVIDATVIHRVGTLEPTDQIVLVLVASMHRGDAFDACAFIMDFLKTDAPFWKKETTPAGTRWVDARSSDEAARARWNQQSTIKSGIT